MAEAQAEGKEGGPALRRIVPAARCEMCGLPLGKEAGPRHDTCPERCPHDVKIVPHGQWYCARCDTDRQIEEGAGPLPDGGSLPVEVDARELDRAFRILTVRVAERAVFLAHEKSCSGELAVETTARAFERLRLLRHFLSVTFWEQLGPDEAEADEG